MTHPMGSHEDFRPHDDDAGAPSDRSFGLVFTAVFVIASGYFFYAGAHGIGAALMAVAIATLALAIFLPRALALPNRVWMRFGLLLHKIVNPIVMGAMFLAVFTPFGLLMRCFGKDPLRRKLARQATSYWIDRESHDQATHSMRNQF